MSTKKRSITALLVAGLLAVAVFWGTPAAASEPFIGQIQVFGFNFAPRGWAFCDGQLLNISQNASLFSLLGTTYGGDGRTTFGLPDLRGRVAVHPGTGPGLPPVRWGQRGGAASHTLTTSQLPSHTHSASVVVHAASGQGSQQSPAENVLAYDRRETQYSASAPDVTMGSGAATVTVGNSGGGQSFGLMQPYLGLNHCIALFGLYPSRN